MKDIKTKNNNKNTKKHKNTSIDSDYEDDSFELDDDEIKKIKKQWPIPLNSWIIKPGENSNRGVGISVSQDMSEIRSLVGGGRNGQESTNII